jgi:hypothetical protein
MMTFGFTNDTKEYDRVRSFRDAAIADRWSHKATYDSEPEERASHLYREGFVMSVLTRSRENEVLNPARGIYSTSHGKWRYEAQVHIWGPDGMAIDSGPVYDWGKLTAGLRHCPECGADDVDTQLVGFANRVCADCAPALRKKIEKPGWCD